jgi:2-polyprenyl-3-methyl-5-hydroxy-6-metoxy-1,4-benzoquinol methylase
MMPDAEELGPSRHCAETREKAFLQMTTLRGRLRRLLDSYVQWNWTWNVDAAMRYTAVTEGISHFATSSTSRRICDVGCGTRGGITAYLKVPAIGVDLVFVPHIVRRFRLCTPVASSALSLPFANGTFEVVVCLDVLEHVPSDKRPLLLDEMFRVVGSRGWVFVGAPCGQVVREAELQANALYRARTGRDHPWLAEHLQNAPLNCDDLQTEITRAAKIHMGHFDIKSFPNMSLRLWKRLRRVLWSQPAAIHFQRLLFQPWFAWLKRRNGPPGYRRIWSVNASESRDENRC